MRLSEAWKMRRALIPLAVVAMLAVTGSPVAAASHPKNDLPAGATAIPAALPQSITQDTTTATVSRKDDFGCGAGGTDQATVWYTFTPAADETVLVDASASSYFVGVNEFAGAADASHLVNCSSGELIFDASAGTTYYLMFSDADGDTVNGGTLSVTLDVAPPPISITLTVDPTAKLSSSGAVATLTGTITCSGPAKFGEVDVFLSQAVGRFTVSGFGSGFPDCGTSPTSWSVDAAGQSGRFSGGSIAAQVSAFACDAVTCGDTLVQATVKARP
jgi:hypothetical protein